GRDYHRERAAHADGTSDQLAERSADLVGKVRRGFDVSLAAAFERVAHVGAVVRIWRRRTATTGPRNGFHRSRTRRDLLRWTVVLRDVPAQYPFYRGLLRDCAGAFGGHGGGFRHFGEPLVQQSSLAPQGGAASLCTSSTLPQPALSAAFHDG